MSAPAIDPGFGIDEMASVSRTMRACDACCRSSRPWRRRKPGGAPRAQQGLGCAARRAAAPAVFAVDLAVRAALKLSNDLVLLAQTELGEVRMRGGGSSSMPAADTLIDRALASADAHWGALTA